MCLTTDALAPDAIALCSAGTSPLSLNILYMCTGKKYRWRNKVEQGKVKWYAKTNCKELTMLISPVLEKNEQSKTKDRFTPWL